MPINHSLHYLFLLSTKPAISLFHLLDLLNFSLCFLYLYTFLAENHVVFIHFAFVYPEFAGIFFTDFFFTTNITFSNHHSSFRKVLTLPNSLRTSVNMLPPSDLSV